MFYKKGIKMSENKKQDEKKLPNWLSFNADGEAVIKLLKEVENFKKHCLIIQVDG